MSHTGTQQLRLKEWLVLQINSGRYPGLRWENEDRTLFRIPWKHASKQDYKAQQDAALFKAWAIYKGKYREGSEKDDPSVWKTRLRCALNKSPDFQEVQENSQMELPEPYKLYRIVSETRERSENVCTEIHESSQKENLEIPPTQDSIQTGEQRSASPIKVQNPYKIQRINETLHNAPGKGHSPVPQVVPRSISQFPRSVSRSVRCPSPSSPVSECPLTQFLPVSECPPPPVSECPLTQSQQTMLSSTSLTR
ncbi:interferon regulatory factor 4-like [Pelobates cultripes]|uniref:Interferon regulatory factor 4-like n=1 Tax=Pelobates cultripes TaxID=61616 RepID=A0AAD1WD19_PELCU|nr:interferon regulatory factor 4-like [Pelobates cultripes]